jgi:hypothetical protein
MKKLLLLSLLMSSAIADVQVKRVGTEYAFSFTQNSTQYCWVMPEWVDLNYFDYAWQTVQTTAVLHSWPAPTPEQAASCVDAPRVPRTVGGPLYTINSSLRVEAVDTVPAGIPCGDPIIRFQFLRAVVYNGQTGFASCS